MYKWSQENELSSEDPSNKQKKTNKKKFLTERKNDYLKLLKAETIKIWQLLYFLA